LAFTANGYQIRTDAETRYKGGECRDVRNGVEADVDGTVNGSGVVYAAKMDLKKNKKD